MEMDGRMKKEGRRGKVGESRGVFMPWESKCNGHDASIFGRYEAIRVDAGMFSYTYDKLEAVRLVPIDFEDRDAKESKVFLYKL
jgi:hypothetical protein